MQDNLVKNVKIHILDYNSNFTVNFKNLPKIDIVNRRYVKIF